MDTQDILALYDREQRIEIEYPDVQKETLPNLVRFIRPAPGMSFILYSRLDETTADAVIEEQIAYFREQEALFEWNVYSHDTPLDLAERLVRRGFVAEDTDAIMVLDLDEAPPALLTPPAADVRRLTDAAQLSEVESVLAEVWGRDFGWLQERLGDHMTIPGYLSIYAAYVDGQPASVGWTYFYAGHFAGLWGGSTLAAYRGRGLYTAVLAARAQEAKRRGYRFLTIDAGPMSRPIVARHGFQLLTHAVDCEWRGG